MRDSRATTHGKRLQIAVIILSQALSDLSFGVIAPFFPGACLDRGIQHGTVGAIFMTQQVVALLFTPLAPWLCRRLGNRGVILGTLVGQGVAALLWAATSELQSTGGFLATAFALRALQGMMQGVFEAAAASMLIKSVHVSLVGTVMGWSESGRAVHAPSGCCQPPQPPPPPRPAARFAQLTRARSPWQLGFLLGPPVGGLLYQLGGFRCPFLATAALATPNQG